MFARGLLEETDRLLRLCHEANLRLVTAESCTGGLIAGCLTEIPGASNVLERGFIVYSNESKEALLGVPRDLFETAGAVSEEVACAMAKGALVATGADLSIAATGLAGPGGGTKEKPVGLVHIAAAARDQTVLHECHHFHGDRTEIRLHTVAASMALLMKQVQRLVA